MENTPTDTQQNDSSSWEVAYWSRIDCIEAELSGTPVSYSSPKEMMDALGVSEGYCRKILFKLRKRLGTHYDKILNNGQL
jgi:DNA-directed RNA polymerase subunit N (RpoN/RPB10)